MSRHISIKSALLIPFGIFIGILLILLVFVWQNDFNWIAKEQGGKIATAVNENTQQKLNELLLDPERVNQILAAELRETQLTADPDFSQLESMILTYYKTVQKSTPQISVISYGDEKGRFVGLRANGLNDFSLMLKDERTKGMLNIYQKENMSSKVVGAYENYDPITRPWYAPVKLRPESQWSEIYVNADEKMEITISSLVPVFDKVGTFRGVADIDVKLNGISSFLREDKTKGSGVVYIIDKEWNVIAHSGSEPAMKLVKDDKGNQTIEMIKSYAFENEMIKTTATYLNTHKNTLGEVLQVKSATDTLFVQMAQVQLPTEFGWRIVSVIPQNDLMGAVKKHQNTSLLIILFMALLLGAVAVMIISKISQPIKLSATAALAIANGNFEVHLKQSSFPISEADELMEALNTMSENLKNSFEKIQLSEEKYRSLIENIDDMIYSLSPDGKFIAINHRFEQEIGQGRKDVIGQGLNIIFKRETELQFWKEQLKRVVESKLKYTYQFSFIKMDGKRRVYNVHLIPMINILGNVEMVLGSNTDITDLVEAQEEIQFLHEKEKATLEKMVDERTEELKIAMEELVEKEKLASLGSLVSGIAHEINTPLGVSVSAASYLKSINDQIMMQMAEGKMTKTHLREYFIGTEETSKILNTNLFRAAELVKSFKEISVNQITESLSYFDLHEYLNMILLSLKHEYKYTGHEIHIECENPLFINSYPGVFAQIFTNLIMNALIHGLKDVKNGHIEIVVEKEDTQLSIHFSDDGMGIPSQNMQKIFEPFFTTNRSKGGSGLGLNVVYNLITGKLGGKISCKSPVGMGTHFYIQIPLRVEIDNN